MTTYLAVNEELQSLRAQLAIEQRALTDLTAEYDRLCRASVDNDDAALEAAVLPAQREMVKARIRGLEIRIAENEAIKTALEIPILEEAERRRRQAEKAKWEDILAQCRAARDERDELATRFKPATKTAADAQEAFEAAQDALEQHRATPIDPLDSLALMPTKLASARRRDTALQNAVREAMKERDDANMEIAQLRTQWLDACQKLAKLAWLENTYRPQGMREADSLGEALAAR